MNRTAAEPNLQIAVLGDAECGERLECLAFETGKALGEAGVCLICGGRGGVMEAACRGIVSVGGVALGILPGGDAFQSPPNGALSQVIFTGMGQARNLSVVLSSAVAIAIGGGWGTLSEIALALKHRIPVVTLESWALNRPDGCPEQLLRAASSPRDAVARALEMADSERLGLL